MKKILFLIQATLPKKFTRREFNIMIRQYSCTTHPSHHLQRLVEKGILKHLGEGTYQQI